MTDQVLVDYGGVGIPETLDQYADRVKRANWFMTLIERGLVPLPDDAIAVRVGPTTVWVLPGTPSKGRRRKREQRRKRK